MKQRKISQLKARRLQKRVAELEQQVGNLYANGHGVFVWTIPGLHEKTRAVLENTRTLGFHLRARQNGENLELYAVK